MKQTAIEYLYNQIKSFGIDTGFLNKSFEQAKEMEKQQIIDAFEYGIGQGFIADNEKLEEIKIKFIQWYLEKNNNETYGKQLKSKNNN